MGKRIATDQPARISDPRFANIQNDPRFRLPSKRNTHVQLDKRFAHVLRDDRFSSNAKVDRYGRKLPSGTQRKHLEKFYKIQDDEVEQELERITTSNRAISPDASSSDDDTSSSDEEKAVFGIVEDEDDKDIPQGEVTSRLAVVNLDWDNIRAIDLMAVFTSFVPGNGPLNVSIFPSEFGKERMQQEEMEGPPKEIFAQASREVAQDGTDSDEDDRLDNDTDEKIKKSLVKQDEGIEFNSAKLRRYQLERLRYYYAVLTCSSTSVAQSIYDAVDGAEYLSTANFFDLRYIPDETTFTDTPRDQCERIPDGYRPNEFVTDALQHSKVKLTWDADDVTRKEAQKRAFTRGRKDIEDDLGAYLGTDSSDAEGDMPGSSNVIVVDASETVNMSDTEVTTPQDTGLSGKAAQRQRTRALLGLEPEPARRTSGKPAPVGDMEITFTSGFTQDKGKVLQNEPEREETTVEKYVRKEKERKAKRREKAKGKRRQGSEKAESEDERNEQGTANESDPAGTGFDDSFFDSSGEIQGRGSKSASKNSRTNKTSHSRSASADTVPLDPPQETETAAASTFKINTHDARFHDLLSTNAAYAIDPSHPRYRDTEGMRALLNEGARVREGKRKRGHDAGEDTVGEDPPEGGKRNAVAVDEHSLVQRKEKHRRKKGKLERRGMAKR